MTVPPQGGTIVIPQPGPILGALTRQCQTCGDLFSALPSSKRKECPSCQRRKKR